MTTQNQNTRTKLPAGLAVLAFGALALPTSAELIHHWEFNDGAGDTAVDSVGANAGGISGATWVTDGTAPRDIYLSFSSDNNSHVDPVLTQQFDLVTNFTWTVWVNDQGSGANNIILGNRRDGGGAEFDPRQFVKLTPTQCEWHPDGGSQRAFHTTLPLDTWVHLAVVKSGDNLQTYYNGVAEGSVTLDAAFTDMMPFFIGGEPNNTAAGEFFNGFIDDVRIYDNALTQEEIRALLVGATLPPYWPEGTITLDPAEAGTPITGGTLADFVVDPREGTGTVSFMKVSGPDWLTVDPDGTLGGTPDVADVGDNVFVVSATNADGTTENDLEIRIFDPNAVVPPLLAGWDTWADIGEDTFDPTFTNSVTAQAVGTVTGGTGIGNWGNAGLNFGSSTDGTWGSLVPGVGIPGPDTTAPEATAGVGFINGTNGYFDFTVTADTTISFTSFNFDSYKRFGGSTDDWALSVVSGAITNGPIDEGTITQAANSSALMDDTIPHDWDVDLTGLPDRELNAGESAVFRLEFTGGNVSAGGGNNTMLDNVGIFGETGAGSGLSLSVALADENLVFTWDSTPGKRYNLRSNLELVGPTIDWPILVGDIADDPVDPEAETPKNELTIVRPTEDPTRFYVLEQFTPPPVELINTGFEDDDGGFTSTVTAGELWARGTPGSSGPGGMVTEGNGGSANCWGTDIGNPGFYADPTTDSCLRSPDIDLSGFTTVSLTFAEALDLAAGDTAELKLINADGDVEIATVYTATDTDIVNATWGNANDGSAIDLSAGTGETVYLQWCLNGTGGNTSDYLGWYIDDVLVTGN